MSYENDFKSVELILNSDSNTKGVDSFILSFIKAEKQMRRIFTYLIFQHGNYSIGDYSDLRQTLAGNRNLCFSGFIKGINRILPRSIEDIYGIDYQMDLQQILLFVKDRNKIFHGQITEFGLSTDELVDRATQIRKWCKHLGLKVKSEIKYDGFSDSYIKSNENLNLNSLSEFETINKYQNFLKTLQR